MSISTTGRKKPYCCLYSCTVKYWYTITSCMFLSCKGQGIEICNSSDLCWNPLCWQSMASSTNGAGSCSTILCAEHCPDTGRGTARYLPSQQIPCCEHRTSHITATAINQSQYTSSLLLHLSDYTKQLGPSTIFVFFFFFRSLQDSIWVRTHQQSRVESNPVQSDSRVKGCSHRPSRVQSSLCESQWVFNTYWTVNK